MKKVWLLVGVLVLAAFHVSAMSDTARYQISLTPQYLALSGIKANFDLRLSARNWLSFSGEVYRFSDFFGVSDLGRSSYYNDGGSSRLYLDNDDLITGAALAVEDKIFFKKKYPCTGTYWKNGIAYGRFHATFQDYSWQPYSQNNLTYYDLTPTNGYMDINKYELYFGIGRAGKHWKSFRADGFIGLGYNWISTTTNMPGYRNYSSTFYDFGYAGIHPIATLQFGWVF